MRLPLLTLLCLFSLVTGCASHGLGPKQGLGSYYGDAHQGKPTASGAPFNQRALTAAHRSLPFGSRVRVTNLNNGKSVVVRINDRGPFVRGRIIDLSKAAAQRIGMLADGVVPVRIELLR